MAIFKNILKTKSDQNIHQNAPNCTILKKFLGGGMPPPCQTLGTPLHSISFYDRRRVFVAIIALFFITIPNLVNFGHFYIEYS